MSLPLARELFPKIIGDLAVSLVGVKKSYTHKLHSQSGLQPGRLLNCASQAIRPKQRQLPILYGCNDSEFYANLPGNRQRLDEPGWRPSLLPDAAPYTVQNVFWALLLSVGLLSKQLTSWEKPAKSREEREIDGRIRNEMAIWTFSISERYGRIRIDKSR